jgi:hypothetical protein
VPSSAQQVDILREVAMTGKQILILTVSSLALVLAGVNSFRHSGAVRAAGAQNRASTEPVIYLNQGWSKADRDTFYWIPQGTVMMSFDIYQNLELADSTDLFRSDANMERYGLIPSPPDPDGNPDGLPIGVTKQVTAEGRWKGTEAGTTAPPVTFPNCITREKRFLLMAMPGFISTYKVYSRTQIMRYRRRCITLQSSTA